MATLDSVLASIPGYGGYTARRQQHGQEDAAELQQAGALMQIAQRVQAQKHAASEEQRNQAMLAEIQALPPDKRTRENVLPIIMKHAKGVSEMVQALPAAPKAQPIGSGGLLQPDGTVIPPAARPDAAQKPAPTRQRYDGTNVVQEEMQADGTWKQIGKGPRFAPERAGTQPKPPLGFRYKADDPTSLEPIPGGPKDTAPKDLAKAKGAVQKANTVIGKVDEALAQTGTFTTGATGTALGLIPGTPAYDLDKTLDTIKANLGFSELQAMRDASPTGGALGQVAIQELAMLQATVASLDKGQSKANLRRGLQQIKQHFENWKRAVTEATPSALGDATPPGGPGAPPAPSAAPGASGWTVRPK